MPGHTRYPLRIAVRAAILAMAPGMAWAQAYGLPQLPTVTVVGKVEQPLSEVAATVSIIDAEQIVGALARDARDLFRFEPGISVGNDPARFGLGAVNIRGLGGNRVLVETDGVPAPAGFAIGSFSDTGRPLTDLGIVQRVEVLRGPASSLYGSDALAGVVALSTVAPGDLLEPGEALAAIARTSYAGVDDGWSTSLLTAGRAGDTSALLGVGWRRSDEADIAAETLDPNPASKYRDTLHLRVEHDTDTGPIGLTATGDRFGAATDVDSLELSGGRFANTVLLRGDDSQESFRLLVDQSLESLPGVDRGEWRMYWQRGTVDQVTYEERQGTSRSAPVAIDRRFRYQDTTLGGEFTVAREFVAGAGSHGLVGGLELSRSRIEERRDGLQTDLDTGETTTVLLGESMPVRDFPVSNVTEAGLYLQDDWRPGEGAFSVIAALRADLYRLDPRPDTLYREDNPAQEPVGVDTFSVSPRLGLTWRLRGGATAFLQYAHGFRAPPFEDVNIGLDLPQFNVRAIPNPDLKPERSDSVELGLRLDGRVVSGSASAWFGRYQDFIQSKVNLGPDPETGVIWFQSQNVARAEIWGLEATLSWSLAGVMPQLEGWTVDLSAAYAHGDDLERSAPLDSVEPTRAVLGLRYAGSSDRFRFGLAVIGAAAKRRVDPTRPDPLMLDGFVSVDCTASWRISETWRVDAGVFNLGDASYLEWSDVRGRPASDPLLDLYRRPGRNWALSLTAVF
jgi:hemoglobin/transferrin/lactoferrin receptor protein